MWKDIHLLISSYKHLFIRSFSHMYKRSYVCTSICSYVMVVTLYLYRCIVDFTEGVDYVLFKTINDMKGALRHLYGGVSEEA